MAKVILQFPNPILSQVSQPVTQVDSAVRDLAKELLCWFELTNRVGIAAVQVGELHRIIAVRQNSESLVIINPEIIKTSEQSYPNIEGCLSINHGESLYEIKRYKIVKVRGIDLNEEPVTYKSRGLFGAVLQHEIDHLNGKMINQNGKIH